MKQCRHCGSFALAWHTTIVNRSDVQQGRLNTNDVECVFFLGCEECSETLVQMGAGAMAGRLNALGLK